MSFRRRIFVISAAVLIILSAAAMGVWAGSQETGGNKVFDISKEFVLERNVHVMQYEEEIVFISCDPSGTALSSFNTDTGAVQKLWESDRAYTASSINGKNVYIALWNPETSGESTTILTYDIQQGCMSDQIKVSSQLKDSSAFAVDENDNIYIADGNTAKQFSKVGRLMYEYTFDSQVLGLRSTPKNSRVCALTTNAITQLIDGEPRELDIPCEPQEKRFISEDRVLDCEGNVYENSPHRQYNTLSGYGSVCQGVQGTQVFNSGKVYSLDEKGNAQGEYRLLVPECELLLANDTKLISLSGIGGDLKAEVMSTDSIKPTEYLIFDSSGNTFTTSPTAGEVYYEDIKDIESWRMIIDLKQICSTLRGEPCVTIDNLTTKTTQTRTPGYGLEIQDKGAIICFTPPEDLLNNRFKIHLSGVCTKDAIPAKLEYELLVKSKDVPPEPGGPKKIESKLYNINRDTGIISNLTPGTVISEFKGNLEYEGRLSIRDAGGNIVQSGKIGTGDKLTLVVDGEVADELTVVIYGDLNGDGNISSADKKLAYRYQLGKDSLPEAAMLAADIDHDGSVGNGDMVKIGRCAQGKYLISQGNTG